MNSKFSYRDTLVYILNGLIAMILVGINYWDLGLSQILTAKIENLNIAILLAIPLSFLLGHLVLSFDHFLFNVLINKSMRDKLRTGKYKFLFSLLFGYRIVAYRDNYWKDNPNDYYQICRTLRNKRRYDHASNLYVLSDSFKGFVLVELVTIIISIFSFNYQYAWLNLLFMILFYFRAKKYSKEYVLEIIGQNKLLNQEIV